MKKTDYQKGRKRSRGVDIREKDPKEVSIVGFTETETFLGEIVVVSQNAENRGYSIFQRQGSFPVKYVVMVSISICYPLRKSRALASVLA